MVKIYKTDDRLIHEENTIQKGVWIHMVGQALLLPLPYIQY